MEGPAAKNTGPKCFSPKTLRQILVEFVTAHPQILVDDPEGLVPVLPVDVLRVVLVNCTEDQLKEIEERSGSSPYPNHLPWYTWHLWYKIYRARYGDPFASAKSNIDLQPVPGDKPCDYECPPGVNPQLEGDWRLEVELQERERQMRLDKLKNRLKSGYQLAHAEKHERSAQVTEKLPPPKRRRTDLPKSRNSAQTLNNHRNVNPKMLQSIGLKASSRPAATVVRRPPPSAASAQPQVRQPPQPLQRSLPAPSNSSARGAIAAASPAAGRSGGVAPKPARDDGIFAPGAKRLGQGPSKAGRPAAGGKVLPADDVALLGAGVGAGAGSLSGHKRPAAGVTGVTGGGGGGDRKAAIAAAAQAAVAKLLQRAQQREQMQQA